jgi:PTS system mannose-specific IID component
MEQERARQEYNNEEITMTDDLMYNTKAGLMGALAGIGDAIDSGTIQYIFIAIAVPWAQEGSAMGALFPFIAFALYQFAMGLFFAKQGFSMGRNATSLMESAGIKTMIDLLSILGLFMMGVLAGNYITVTSSLSFDISGREFVIQEILDKIVPGLLPLATVMGVYLYYTKKGLKVTQALLWLTGILIVLAAIGIL